FIVSLLVFGLLFVKSFRNKVIDTKIRLPLGWVIVLLIAISLPTILVESTSQIWFPGSRSLMIQQVWQPLLYLSILFFVMNLFFKQNNNRLVQVGTLSIVS